MKPFKANIEECILYVDEKANVSNTSLRFLHVRIAFQAILIRTKASNIG